MGEQCCRVVAWMFGAVAVIQSRAFQSRYREPQCVGTIGDSPGAAPGMGYFTHETEPDLRLCGPDDAGRGCGRLYGRTAARPQRTATAERHRAATATRSGQLF